MLAEDGTELTTARAWFLARLESVVRDINADAQRIQEWTAKHGLHSFDMWNCVWQFASRYSFHFILFVHSMLSSLRRSRGCTCRDCIAVERQQRPVETFNSAFPEAASPEIVQSWLNHVIDGMKLELLSGRRDSNEHMQASRFHFKMECSVRREHEPETGEGGGTTTHLTLVFAVWAERQAIPTAWMHPGSIEFPFCLDERWWRGKSTTPPWKDVDFLQRFEIRICATVNCASADVDFVEEKEDYLLDDPFAHIVISVPRDEMEISAHLVS